MMPRAPFSNRLSENVFARKVAAARVKAGMSQWALAERAGVGIRAVRDIELGVLRSFGAVEAVLGALGLRISIEADNEEQEGEGRRKHNSYDGPHVSSPPPQ